MNFQQMTQSVRREIITMQGMLSMKSGIRSQSMKNFLMNRVMWEMKLTTMITMQKNQPDLDGSDDVVGSSNHGGHGRWLLIASVPIVTVLGIAIATWLRNSMAGGRIHCGVRDQDMPQSHRYHGRTVHTNWSRRWWSLS